MDMIAGIGPAYPSHSVTAVQPFLGAGRFGRSLGFPALTSPLEATRTVVTRPDGSVLTTVKDASGTVVSLGVAPAEVSRMTAIDGSVIDRIMSPAGTEMYVRVVSSATPEDVPSRGSLLSMQA